jgi:site-specific recombinase XerC
MARSSAKHSAAKTSDSVPLTAWLPSWKLALDAQGRSLKTIRSYTDSVRKLSAYLAAAGLTDDVESTGPAEVRAFLVSERERTAATSAQIHYRNLRVYFGWLIREGERSAANPVMREDKPSAPESSRSCPRRTSRRCSRRAGATASRSGAILQYCAS